MPPYCSLCLVPAYRHRDEVSCRHSSQLAATPAKACSVVRAAMATACRGQVALPLPATSAHQHLTPGGCCLYELLNNWLVSSKTPAQERAGGGGGGASAEDAGPQAAGPP